MSGLFSSGSGLSPACLNDRSAGAISPVPGPGADCLEQIVSREKAARNANGELRVVVFG